MPVTKKRKIAICSESSNTGLCEPASTSVIADESMEEKASGDGELTESVSVTEGNVVQNQERLERFKALQARAVSVSRLDIRFHQHLSNNEKITNFIR